MLGACIGDVIGSVYEGARWNPQPLSLFDTYSTFTDDTVCTVAVADALVQGIRPEVSLRAWAGRYPGRGYGGLFQRWVNGASEAPYGSYANGACMRVSPAGLLARSVSHAEELATLVTRVTHDHPDAIRGARCVAALICMGRRGSDVQTLVEVARSRFQLDAWPWTRAVEEGGNTDRCTTTVELALTCVLNADCFEKTMRNCISVGGDTDTIAATAGPIAEAVFGIPDAVVKEGLNRLDDRIAQVLSGLYEKAGMGSALWPGWNGSR